jgi:hypothetical protein
VGVQFPTAAGKANNLSGLYDGEAIVLRPLAQADGVIQFRHKHVPF